MTSVGLGIEGVKQGDDRWEVKRQKMLNVEARHCTSYY